MANYTIEKLINDSIRVYDGMTVFYPHSAKAEAINNMSELAPKFNGCYATNNSTVAFVHNGNFYVTPYTREAIRTLMDSGFLKEDFYVPFSNGDYPRDEQHKWEVLRLRAREAHYRAFIDDCNRYCDERGIRALSDETLERCLKMPSTGVRVKHPHFEDCYYPVINNESFDATAVEVIGHYGKNNGRVVFVYRDGATYVAKGYKLIQELEAAGYTRSNIFVPFSNGEEIQDSGLRERWNSITKFQ